MFSVFLLHFFRVCAKQCLRSRLNAGKLRLVSIREPARELARELAFDPCGSNCMTVVRSAFVRFRQELLQQSQIYGVNELHKFCPVFQLRGRDPREVFHVQGMLCFMLQERNKKSLAFKIIRLFYAVDRAVGRSPAACAVPAESQIIHPASKKQSL